MMSDLERKVELLVSIALCDDDARKEELLQMLRPVQENIAPQPVANSVDREYFIAGVLNDLGIPSSRKGYHYLIFAITLIVDNPYVRHSITSKVYPRVSAAYGATPSSVERAIRTAIERCVRVSSAETMYKYFANTIYPKRSFPTNSEFMCQLADFVAHNYNKLTTL